MSEMVFGERLRMLRKQARLTQQDVAEALRIHRTTYTRYEAGTVAPDQQGLVQLAEMFGVTVDYLLGRETDSGSSALSEGEADGLDLSLQEKWLLQMYRQLTYAEQQELQKQLQKSFNKKKKNVK